MGNGFEWAFLQKDLKMASEHMRRCSISLVIRDIQIEITMKYHFIPTRLTIIKKDE